MHAEFLAAGGNRHPAAGDWASGLLAFGAGNNVALWDPDNTKGDGITSLLGGHSATVNVVKIIETPLHGRVVLSGSSDHTVRIWKSAPDSVSPFEAWQCLSEHQGSVNIIATRSECHVFATGSADGTIKIWELTQEKAKLVQSISLKPNFIPLALAFTILDSETIVLAAAGTSTIIHLYTRKSRGGDFRLQTKLSGHEGWVRSLDFVSETNGVQSDHLLASASQDRYIRLWRLSKSEDLSPSQPSDIAVKSLANKTHLLDGDGVTYTVAFEALLIGHEDWIFTCYWSRSNNPGSLPQLLSASADNSLAIWNKEHGSDIWVCKTRLGEISSQKGATTATGSTGGFWIGLWSPSAESVVSLGRTGSWRRWSCTTIESWTQRLGISGHTNEVRALTWAPDGSYLLSTSSDQTTRLFSEWESSNARSWHEFARPQIHGYDLNCITCLTSNQFVSGADEKLLRVFSKPRLVDFMLSKLCGIPQTLDETLPDAASMPVLGLSNKATTSADDGDDGGEDGAPEAQDTLDHRGQFDIEHPPFEDMLARQTLWPEYEKLYGHGYEISAVATNPSGSMIATACKASSVDHAVVRIFETKEWREVKPPLRAHNLTVTDLAFSPDGHYLLSVGRDRQWALFEQGDDSQRLFSLLCSDVKGHNRMILSCCWAPSHAGYLFATGGRDKTVKLWQISENTVAPVATIKSESAVTAISFAPGSDERQRLVYGTDQGNVVVLHARDTSWVDPAGVTIPAYLLPTKTITALSWRPTARPSRGEQQQVDDIRGSDLLAIASEDNSIRLLRI